MIGRLLIVRLGALGDIVHAIPVAAALRRAFPAARIDWLVGARHRDLLDLVPVIDRRLVWAGGGFAANDGGGRGRISEALAAIRELRQARYDVAIDLQGLLKSAVLARASGAARVLGFASTYLRERLARPFYTDAYDPGCSDIYDARETRHVVQINLGLLQPLGLTAATAEFPIERVESGIARTISERTAGRYAVLNPGAAWPNKRWPPTRFGAVAVALRDRHGLASIVTWGPGEQGIAEQVVAASYGAAILTPPTSVADLVALARGASLMISGDTGPTHIATALGTPLVGIYGPTRPSRNGPWSPADVVVSRDRACRCLHLRRCRFETMCLMDVGVEEVLQAVERRLAAEPTRV
jgi:lipopolysaccharide heptosyltransferase I